MTELVPKVARIAKLSKRVALFLFFWCKGHRKTLIALAVYLLIARYWWFGSWALAFVPLVVLATLLYGFWLFGYWRKVKAAGGHLPGQWALLRACWFEMDRLNLARNKWDFACRGYLTREQTRATKKAQPPMLRLHDAQVAVEGDPVTATIKPGNARVPVEKVIEAAPLMAEAIGCREVVVTRGEVNGQANVAMYWRDSVGSYLPIKKLPLPRGACEAVNGIRRNGSAATESWEAGPVLLVGATGSGKSIDIWNMLIDLGNRKIPHQVAASDPKGGMELDALGRHVGQQKGPLKVTHFTTNPQQTAKMIRDLLAEMNRRQEIAKGSARKITKPTASMPLIVCILDELHDVLPALLADKKAGQQPPIMTLLQQGRSVMVWVIAACQDSKATVLGDIRDKFTQKLLKRVSYSTSVNTVISEGLKRGANAHLLDKIRDRGVGFSEDEFGNIERYRSGMVTDEDINRYVEGLSPKGMTYASRSGRKAAKKDTYVYHAMSKDQVVNGLVVPFSRNEYVGISNDCAKRFEQHRQRDWAYCRGHGQWENWWLMHVDESKMVIEGPFTREVAEKMIERGKIESSWPVWNEVHNWENPVAQSWGKVSNQFPTRRRTQDPSLSDPIDDEAAELVEKARRVPLPGAGVFTVLMFCALMSAAVLRVG